MLQVSEACQSPTVKREFRTIRHLHITAHVGSHYSTSAAATAKAVTTIALVALRVARFPAQTPLHLTQASGRLSQVGKLEKTEIGAADAAEDKAASHGKERAANLLMASLVTRH